MESAPRAPRGAAKPSALSRGAVCSHFLQNGLYSHCVVSRECSLLGREMREENEGHQGCVAEGGFGGKGGEELSGG